MNDYPEYDDGALAQMDQLEQEQLEYEERAATATCVRQRQHRNDCACAICFKARQEAGNKIEPYHKLEQAKT